MGMTPAVFRRLTPREWAAAYTAFFRAHGVEPGEAFDRAALAALMHSYPDARHG